MNANTRTVLEQIAAVLDSEGIREAYDILRDRQSVIAKSAVRSLAIGSFVKFEARGRRVVGRVTAKNTKTVTVDEVGIFKSWRVSPGLLSPATEADVNAVGAATAARPSVADRNAEALAELRAESRMS